MNNKTKITLVATGLGFVEGAIGNLVIKKHLETEGWIYDKGTNQYIINSPSTFIKQTEAEHYKNTVYAVVGVAAIITGLIVRKVMK